MADQPCTTVNYIDHDDVVNALQGLPLDVKQKVECGASLSRAAFDELAPKSVRVQSSIGYGSGFFVGENGDMVVTNNHVVAGTKTTTVETVDGEKFRARIVDIDDIDDLALLKVEGITKDPRRAVTIGDEKDLKPGSPLVSVGHPEAYEEPVASAGYFNGTGSFIDQPPNVLNSLASKYFGIVEHNPEYVKDAVAYLHASRLSVSTPIINGNSGGAIVDKKLEVVGVAQSINTGDLDQSFAVPGSKVSELLNRKEPKFSFRYDTRLHVQRDPEDVLLYDGLAIGVSFAFRKFIAPIHGLSDGIDAVKDFGLATQAQTFAPRSQYIIDGLEKTAGVAGGIMSLFPQTRAIGYGLFGVSLLYEVGQNLLTPDETLTNVTRTDGEQRQPFDWKVKLMD